MHSIACRLSRRPVGGDNPRVVISWRFDRSAAPLAAIVSVCLLACGRLAADESASGSSAHSSKTPVAPRAAELLSRYCVDCHSGESAEARFDVESLLAEPSMAETFRDWGRVIEKIDRGEMPPAEAERPSLAERATIVESISAALDRGAARDAGQPGRVVLRRLTGAEYGYSVEDLTGLSLGLERQFVSDTVGGEGFANTGEVQFVEDASLERYLEAARTIARHTIVGAGPLAFHAGTGDSALELSAIERIQGIYRQHGFRLAAGEGAVPYGLDRYSQAFHAAWRYRHRRALGLADRSLEWFATEAGTTAAWLAYVSSILDAESVSYPTSELVAAWRAIPPPRKDALAANQFSRAAAEALGERIRDWQRKLVGGDDEETAALFDADDLTAKRSRGLSVRSRKRGDERVATFRLFVEAAQADDAPPAIVLWRDANVRFQQEDDKDGEEAEEEKERLPLAKVITPESSARLPFGVHPLGRPLAARDLATLGASELVVDIALPAHAIGVSLSVKVELDATDGRDCVVQCGISHRQELGQDGVASLLADPEGAAWAEWKSGVVEFARRFPPASHREPTPSDRDPIPAPFDNSYNNAERNAFHYQIKYVRDDRFLVERMLDDATRRRLDEAWADLYSACDYHDVYLRFLGRHYQLDWDGMTLASLDRATLDALPDEIREHVNAIVAGREWTERMLREGRRRHVDDSLRLAQRAWRRPLDDDEAITLSEFYEATRGSLDLSHDAAVRALVARIFTAPAFLYRLEPPTVGTSVAELSSWALASRLSYWLWSSVPDEELLRAAAAGELSDTAKLAAQARRMLRDPKARRLAAEFFGQWLGFYRFDDFQGVDRQRFPEFTDELRSDLHEEAVRFFEHIIRADRPIEEALFADYAVLNSRLAAHYGMPAAEGDVERWVVTKGAREHGRGGVLGLGAVLAATSAPLRTSAVKRGDWLLRRVLGTPTPPPPADVASIPPDDVGVDGLTARARLERHRQDAACAACHDKIDPLGFALENYDVLGRWRDRDAAGAMIDASSATASGETIDGPEGLRRYLKSEVACFHRTLCAKLLAYALGRGELLTDRGLVAALRSRLAAGDATLADLVELIATSRQFRFHRAAEDEPLAAALEESP